MTKISFPCDRCGTVVEGLHTPVATSGFYVVSGNSCWTKYSREGEHFVCDTCIQSAPEYRSDYGLAAPA